MNFAKIFFRQLSLNLDGHQLLNIQSSNSGIKQAIPDPVTSQASLPSKKVGQFLLSVYVSRIHIWWPIFHLLHLREWFRQIYLSPQSSDVFQKYVIFMVLALASITAAEMAEYSVMLDIFSPNEYFATAMRFHEQISSGIDLQSLQAALLLTIWMMQSSTQIDNANLWQISRFALSMAIELGCHRNLNSNFGIVENEMRNRVWWCAYALER